MRPAVAAVRESMHPCDRRTGDPLKFGYACNRLRFTRLSNVYPPGVNHYIKGRHAPVEEHHKVESREHLHSNRHCASSAVLRFSVRSRSSVDHELPATRHRVPAAGPGGLPAAGVRRSAACCRQLLPAAGPAAGTGGQRRRLLERMLCCDLLLLSARHVLLITRVRTANTRQSYDDLHLLIKSCSYIVCFYRT